MKPIFLMRLFFCAFWLVCVGCANTKDPYAEPERSQDRARLEAQLKSAQAQYDQGGAAGRVLFAGLAMDSTTHAFMGDVFLTEKWMKTIDPNAIVFKLNNPASGQSADVPYALFENMSAVFSKLGALARPQDKIVVLISTHGADSVLSVKFSEKYPGYVNVPMLKYWLNFLGNRPVLLVLSACHSGSFLAPLAAPNRVILTAAAAGRASFGCGFPSQSTFFTQALFGDLSDAGLSLTDLMEKAQSRVAGLEASYRLKPSLPQIYVGGAVKDWANQPMKDWVKKK